jgi:hypothetical protein
MKKIALLISIIASSNCLLAQDATVVKLKKDSELTIKKDEKDTITQVWKKGGNFNLNVNQGSLSNWSAGGDKFSFSLNAYLNLYAFYKKNKHSWDNSIDLAYGIVQTTSLGKRKSSDRIDYTSKYGYAIHKHLNLASLFNLRSQFANGYSYEKKDDGNEKETLTSKTFAPAYVLLSLGLDFKPKENLSVFISPASSRWVLVSDQNLGQLYGLDSGKTVKSELGAFLSANYTAKLGNNFTYKSKLDLFSNYKVNPQNVDVFWTNVITAKITRYINFSFNVDMIYDDDTHNIEPDKGPAPQWLQLMGIGFAYKFDNKPKNK